MNFFSSFLTYIKNIWTGADLIDTFNIYAAYIILIIAALALLKFAVHAIRSRRISAMEPSAAAISAGHTTPACGFLVFLVLAAGGFLRFWNLAGLPDGLQQDEASIGYEAYSLLHYGIDRNGYHFPVYPITWGSGGGSPLMIYLNVLTTAIFGSNIFAIRFVPALLGTLTLLVFYCFLKKAFGNGTALAGLVILTLTPWHIILSRWSLDANTMPFWQILAAMVFLLAASKSVQPFVGENEAFDTTRKQTHQYLLSAFLFGLCLYSYGSANFVIPVTLLIMAVWAVRHQVLSGRQLAGSIVIFLLTVSPLAFFYGVNYLGFPEIATRWISFPKFTSSHFGSVFLPLNSQLPGALWNNLVGLAETLTFGRPGEVSWNAMPGYPVLYAFTWPVTLLGLFFGGGKSDTAREARKHRGLAALSGKFDSSTVSAYLCEWKYRPDRAVDTMDIANALMRTYFIIAVLFALFIQQDINREVLLFLPLVYWNTAGLRWIWRLPVRVKIPKAAEAEGTPTAGRIDTDQTAGKAVPTASPEDSGTAAEDSQAAEGTGTTAESSIGTTAESIDTTAESIGTTAESTGLGAESTGTTAAPAPDGLPEGITLLDADQLVASIQAEDQHPQRMLLPKQKTGFRLGRLLAIAAFLVFLAGGTLFLRDYYGGAYNRYCAEDFMPGYGDAMVYADSLARQIDAQLAAAASAEPDDSENVDTNGLASNASNSTGSGTADADAASSDSNSTTSAGDLFTANTGIRLNAGDSSIESPKEDAGNTTEEDGGIDSAADSRPDSSAAVSDTGSVPASTVYSTYQHVASPFMLTLYYTKYDPHSFISSVVWKDPDAEFRVASSFGHFVFGLPVADETDLSSLAALTDDRYRNDVFVLTTEEAAVFDDAAYNKVAYKDRFVVVSRKQGQ